MRQSALIVEKLAQTEDPVMSAGNYVEAAIVVDMNRDPVLSRRFNELLEATQIKVEPVTLHHAEIARQAYRDFGKGSGHRAGLNFGDCCAYALARVKKRPLLYKGDDFVYTGIDAVLE